MAPLLIPNHYTTSQEDFKQVLRAKVSFNHITHMLAYRKFRRVLTANTKNSDICSQPSIAGKETEACHHHNIGMPASVQAA
jgi:hypothetical protein